jgi:hypothetical protein
MQQGGNIDMTRVFGIALGYLGAVTLAPVERASAQQISACVNNSSGTIRIVQNGICHGNETLLVWNVAGPQGPIGPAGPTGATGPAGPAGPPGGAIAAREYICGNPPQSVGFGQNVLFNDSGIGFGTTLPTGPSISTFILQPGIYQAHLTASAQDTIGEQTFNLALNGTFSSVSWLVGDHPEGYRLFSVTAPNTGAALQINNPVGLTLPGGQISSHNFPPVLLDSTIIGTPPSRLCQLIITQLH